MRRRVYSRLSSIEEKRNIKKAFVLAFISLVSVIFLFFSGIPLFAKFATFMSNLGKSDKPIEINDTTPPAPPQISLENEYSNKKSIEISGNSEAGAIVIVTLNSNDQEQIADNSGLFSFNLVLKEGENILFATAKDQAGNISQPSNTYTVTYDSASPEIIIDSPSDGSEFFGNKQNQVTITGKTEVNSLLTINERIVSVDDDGVFSFTTTLSEGDNDFIIKAIDNAGNETQKSLSLRFTP